MGDAQALLTSSSPPWPSSGWPASSTWPSSGWPASSPWPSPIVLVVGGGLIALIPGLPRITLAPDVVFFVFLPPLVHLAGWYASPQELRAVVKPLTLLAVGLVLVTAAAVGAVGHALVPGMDWAEAAVTGAVLAPTDAVAATATFSRLGAPERTRLLAEGE